MLESISAFLAPPHIQHVLATLRGLFCVACLLLLVRCVFHFAPYRLGRKPRLWLFPILFAAGAFAILAYQATWQLGGYLRPDFVRFMERYNPRPDNIAHRLIRGDIRDRNGERLAYTETDGSGRRVYPFENATAHVVGFRHPSEGLTGMEGASDDLLSGYRRRSFRTELKEAGAFALRDERHVGTNVVLTIDSKLQLRACALFQRNFPGGRGAAVALDPRDGSILALYSHPSFDPNRFDRRLNIDPASPLLNRALHGRYPAGSTFKTVVAGLMYDCQVPLTLACPADGYYPPGARRPIRDHEYYAYERKGLAWPGFGTLDLPTALAKSSNTYFAHGGVLCGTSAFNALADRLGFNERLPIYSNETAMVSCQKGHIPRLGKAEKRELSQLCIGQGTLLVTPLHMAMIAGAIANGGTMMTPRLTPDTPPSVRSQVFAASTAKKVRAAMRKVVQTGTGRKADLPGHAVCGKTGTAQNPGGADHGWFICFAPEEAPEIAVAVVVENAGFGSSAALPIAAGILEAYFAGKEEGR